MKGLIFNFIIAILSAGLTGYCFGVNEIGYAIFNLVLTIIDIIVLIGRIELIRVND
jgi:hypothetical protein